MGTIVALRGPEAAGKSMLHTLMIRGQSQYWSSSRLDGIRRHNSAFGIPTAFVFAYEGGLPLLPLVERAIADKDYLVLETVDADHGLLKEACGNFDLLRTWLVLPKWLLEARRRYRLIRPGWTTAENVEQHPIRGRHSRNMFCSDNLQREYDLSPETMLTIDARDFPMVEVPFDEAMRITENRVDVFDLGRLHYQKAVRVGDQWYGPEDAIPFQRGRFDTILPADMTGMDVLDVGARNGAFCFESINRGALWAVAVENAPEAVAIIKQLRNKHECHVTVADIDIEKAALPRMQFKPLVAAPVRYSLALLTNILHHVKAPDVLLKSALMISDAAVIETPPLLGKRWPGWVYAVADSCGCAVTSIEPATVHPESRHIVRIERVTG